MRNYKLIVALLLITANVQAQQTIQQTIFLRANGINSTELLMYKIDNSNYYSLYSNTAFGIYNSNTAKSSFYISGDDKVGIGTTDPKGYKLAVAGSMIAESVKVAMQSTWSDFVFAKGYVPPTLKEIEKHIKEKGHLPGIPSAADVKANGIDLGDMNAKLLQKIEELTLYLIEMKKEIRDQRHEINLLKSNKK